MVDPAEDKDHLDDLRKSLYSRAGPRPVNHISPLHQKQYSVSEDWQDGNDSVQTPQTTSHGMSLFKKIFIFSITFFVLAVGLSVFIFLRGGDIISSNNIAISVLGPTAIGAGNILSLDVDVSNKNTVPLQLVDMVITFPDGTRTASDTTQVLSNQRISLGDIASGETVQKTIQSILFGQQGDSKQIDISIEYRLAGSNAVFSADKLYLLTISSSPISLTVNTLNEINSGQALTIDAKINSNSSDVVKGAVFTASYPFGFQFENATPTPSSSNNVWALGDIEAGGSRDIQVTGVIVGEDNDQKVFKFSAGTATPDNPNLIATTFMDTSQAVIIQKPFLELALSLDEKEINPYVIGVQNGSIRGQIS